MYGFARKRRKGNNQDWGRIWVDFRRLTRDEKNSRIAALTSGCPAFQKHAKHAEGSNTPLPRTFRKYCAQSEKTATSPNCKKITQPSGAATPRDSDAHKRIAVPKALCVLWEHPRPSPKSGKVCRFKPRPRRVSETCGTLRG